MGQIFYSQGDHYISRCFLGVCAQYNLYPACLKMGSCYPSNLPSLPPPPQILDYAMPLHFDQTHPMFESYLHYQGGIFQKQRYIWHSIPITTPFRMQNIVDPLGRPYFQVRNKGIKDDNFVVGIITKIAMKSEVPMPWSTLSCLCLESHQNQNQSAVIFNQKPVRLPKGVRNGQAVRVTLQTNNEIYFSIQGVCVHRCPIPNQMRHDEIVPYVALFSPGDRIEFANEINPERQ